MTSWWRHAFGLVAVMTGVAIGAAGASAQTPPSKPAAAPNAAPATADASPHNIRFVTTSDSVKLEVLDWGGQGRPLLFIPGLGANAHVFDAFAPRFVGKYHVYGVTRRGYGASDHPDPAAGADYSADRLGDDVLTVMDALKLEKPILAGWSMGGEEMSSIISRFPQSVSGAVYLDAAYGYSFYQTGNVAPDVILNLAIDANDLARKVRRLQASDLPTPDAEALLADLQNNLAETQADLLTAQKAIRSPGARSPVRPRANTLATRINEAVLSGVQKYTVLNAPILAIFAAPHATAPNATEDIKAAWAWQDAQAVAAIKHFEAANPRAKVVRVPNALHQVFTSNPDDVAREMNAFLEGLK